MRGIHVYSNTVNMDDQLKPGESSSRYNIRRNVTSTLREKQYSNAEPANKALQTVARTTCLPNVAPLMEDNCAAVT